MATQEDPGEADRFDLARFLDAQDGGTFERALSELRRGRKVSHWMWYIFPQVAGLGYSPAAQKYAIRSLEEARSYLNHPVLGPRLLQCCRALLSIRGLTATDVMGTPDDLKLRSSMTLFNLAGGEQTEFKEVLERYYGGRADERTHALLENP